MRTKKPKVVKVKAAKSDRLQSVWLLQIDHRHGINTYVCASNEIALGLLDEYVEEWWDSEIGDSVEKPALRDHRIEAYFDRMEETEGEESYSLEITEILYESTFPARQ